MKYIFALVLASSVACALNGQGFHPKTTDKLRGAAEGPVYGKMKIDDPLNRVRQLLQSNNKPCSPKDFCTLTLRERPCRSNSCLKRSAQDEMGPFWAHRGKRNPTYTQDRLLVEEPHWLIVRRDDENFLDFDPFFVTRGKKEFDADETRPRDHRLFDDSPFHATRGKKSDGVYN